MVINWQEQKKVKILNYVHKLILLFFGKEKINAFLRKLLRFKTCLHLPPSSLQTHTTFTHTTIHIHTDKSNVLSQTLLNHTLNKLTAKLKANEVLTNVQRLNLYKFLAFYH